MRFLPYVMLLAIGGCDVSQTTPTVPEDEVLLRVQVEGVDLGGRTPMVRVHGWSVAPQGMTGPATWNVKLDPETRFSFYRGRSPAEPASIAVGTWCDIHAVPANALPYRFVASRIVLDD